MQGRRLSRWTTVLFTALAVLVATAELPPAANAQEASGQLNIVIVEGEGAINNIRQRVAREPIVRVEDENRRPVAGAAVVFLLPNDGAGGVFPGGERMLTVQTDQNGQAVARGLQPNSVAGDFTIRVTASYQGRTANALIGQTNAVAGAAAGAAGGAAAAGISGKVIGIIAIIGAAVAGGTYAATRGNGDNGGTPGPAPRPPTAVSIGSPTVGAP